VRRLFERAQRYNFICVLKITSEFLIELRQIRRPFQNRVGGDFIKTDLLCYQWRVAAGGNRFDAFFVVMRFQKRLKSLD